MAAIEINAENFEEKETKEKTWKAFLYFFRISDRASVCRAGTGRKHDSASHGKGGSKRH